MAASIAGDTALIGASGEASNATGVNGNGSDNSVPSAGAAYAFRRTGSTWTQQAYLKASSTGADQFGGAVATTGTTAVVGAIFEDSNATGVNGNGADNSASNAGAAYVFDLTAWTDLGSGLAGVSGVPKLVGTGTLVVGSAGALALSNAKPSAPAALVAALSSAPSALFCGTLLPSVAGSTILQLPTSATGRIDLVWTSWLPGLSGQSLYCQWIVGDSASGCTIALSNAVRGDVP